MGNKSDWTKVREWEHAGLQCVVARGPLGNLNGYVRVPNTHPWFDKGYSNNLCGHDGCYEHTPESLIRVHGGLTFGGNWLTDDPSEWWFGFDTAHAGDLVPGLGHVFDGGVERDESYVSAECERLANQLRAVWQYPRLQEVDHE